MKRVCIGLSIALVIFILLGVFAHILLKDYFLPSDSWIPKLDLERFINDKVGQYISYLYGTPAEEAFKID